MFKFILFSILGWFLYKTFKGSKINFRKTTIHKKEGENKKIKLNEKDIEDAEFKDLDE